MWSSMYVGGATISVDTFFLMGGLLLSYSFLKTINKGTEFNIGMFYIHRYFR